MSQKRYPNKLETKIYRTETHTQKYIHWKSNHSKNCKLGILKGLIHRAHLLCDRGNSAAQRCLHSKWLPKEACWENCQSVLENRTRKEMKRIADEVSRNEQPVTHPDDEETSEYYDCLYAPYIQGFSERLQKLSLIHIWRCRRIERCRSRWSPYH